MMTPADNLVHALLLNRAILRGALVALPMLFVLVPFLRYLVGAAERRRTWGGR